MNDYILLLDPSLRDNNGHPSLNIGDVIIYHAIKDILHELFPGKEIKRMSTHIEFGRKEKEAIHHAAFTFVGGTNLLTSDIRHFSRLTPVRKKLFYLFPGFRNIILLGAGWHAYETGPDFPTRMYYRNILNREYKHALRENYAIDHLRKCALSNLLHTACPTMWQLHPSFSNRFNPGFRNILFTLTDYDRNISCDSDMIKQLFAHAGRLVFFPQGSQDLSYLSSMEIYKKNQSKFILLGHDYSGFIEFIRSEKFNYVGTRLHAGITALQFNHPSLIIGIDNRALEIKKDTGLNVTGSRQIPEIATWLEGQYVPPSLQLPLQNIAAWKKQFLR